MNKKALPFITILIIVVAFLVGLKITAAKYQGNGSLPTISSTPTPNGPTPTEAPKYPITLGNFLVTDREICKENGKPTIYYFGSSSCPHCQWESPVIKKVMEKFTGVVSFHNNMDSDKDQDVFTKYSDINPGYIPFVVAGCKYVRVGSGETEGEVKEIENLSAIICKLADNKPASVCNPLKTKISEIK